MKLKYAIGNYAHDAKGNLIIVDGILRDGSIIAASGCIYVPGRAMPIILTDDELLRLGFVFDGASFNLGIIRLFRLKNALVWDANGAVVVPVQWVHQLQNLFFALTDKELTYPK